MSDCIFCKIVSGEIPGSFVYEDDKVVAFKDINPQSPVHILVVPREHIDSVAEIDEGNDYIAAHIFKVISKLAKELGISESGYRVVTNVGEDGGQTVRHLHYHVLGGRTLQWPPG